MDIAEYRFRTNTYYWHWLELRLKDGSKCKIYHDRSTVNKDDYLDFLKDFKLMVAEANAGKAEEEDRETASTEAENESTSPEVSEKTPSAEIAIRKGTDIYDTKGGIVLAGFAILLIISFPVLLFMPVQNPSSFGLLGAFCIGAAVYLYEFYTHRRAKLKGEETET
ncbi:MAG: hypothetical protein ACYC5A_10215 [Thermoleophilia bacterium]